MSVMTHWHGIGPDAVSVSGNVDDECCADQPDWTDQTPAWLPASTETLRSGLRLTADTDAAARLKRGLAQP